MRVAKPMSLTVLDELANKMNNLFIVTDWHPATVFHRHGPYPNHNPTMRSIPAIPSVSLFWPATPVLRLASARALALCAVPYSFID